MEAAGVVEAAEVLFRPTDTETLGYFDASSTAAAAAAAAVEETCFLPDWIRVGGMRSKT